MVERPQWRWLSVKLLGFTFATWFTIAGLAIILTTGWFVLDTAINNRVVQPLQRSRLDSDADYRRGIEAQARGDISLWHQARTRLPNDTHALTVWLSANPGPNYSIVQSEEYANLQAQVQGDTNTIARSANDYDALLANPDNSGLREFDPSLPPSLDPVP